MLLTLLFDLTVNNRASVWVKEKGWKSGAENPLLVLKKSHICMEEYKKSFSSSASSRHHQPFEQQRRSSDTDLSDLLCSSETMFLKVVGQVQDGASL